MASYDVWKLDIPTEEQEELDYPESYEDYYVILEDDLSDDERLEWDEERAFFARMESESGR